MCKSSPRMAPTLAAVTARAAPAVPTAAMARAEAAAAEVVRCVQPTEASERRRAELVGYASRLVGSALGCEVFAVGSVPLKTYLPDGDIDLTVLGNTSHDGCLIDDVYCTLVPEEQNSDAEFEVKDLQRIDAEVKLIKCTIDNIIVDISFNQTGGMCALCFLELVDREIGKEHLFKRSIILIKAWCYYESRLLGAHHGLISTYALEVLILYIFNLFHKSLDGPLEVLYRFLEYFSKFDWDKYCISLNGPVALSSMPDSPNLIVETTSMPGNDLLFDKEFFESSVEKETDECCTKLRVKHLNIIDPLKECNNLGRSVNKANFNRIRTALSYGARRLGEILMLPSELVPDEILCFFVNTVKRNGKGVRPNIRVDGYDCDVHCQPFIGPDRALLEDLSSMKISYKKNDENRINRLSQNFGNNSQNNEINVPTQGGYFPGDHMLPPSTDLSKKSSHFFHYAPKQYSYVCQENGNGGSGQYYVDHEMMRHMCSTAEAFHDDAKSLMPSQVRVSNSSHILDSSTHGNAGPANKKSWSRTLPHVEKQHLPPLSTLSLPDLSGDLDSQLRCLRQVQYHLEYLFDELFQSVQEASSEGLWSPSSTESNESSSLSSSNSTGDVSQQSQDEDHWSVACQQNAFGIDVPSGGLLPSYYDDSESPVLCCCSLEKIASMHGTGPYTREKHMALLEETGKSRSNQPVEVIYNQAIVPKGSFVPYKEQVALDSRTKELKTNQLWKTEGGLHGYVLSGRKMIENWSGDTRKGCVKPDNKAWQVSKYYGKVCSNKNLFQKRSNCNDMEFARPARAMKQTPKHQALEVQVTTNSRICINNKSGRKQSYGTRKGHQIFDWPTNERPICEQSNLQSSLRGRVFSNKNLAVKQSYDNHSERLSSISDTKHTSNSQGVTILNGSTKKGNPGKGLAEDGSKPWSLLPKEPLSHVSGASQEMLTTSCQPCFSVMKEYSQSEALVTPPEEPIEFGSLGPCPLKFFSSESNKAHNGRTTSYACTDASSLVLQSYRVGATQSRSAGFYKIGDDDHFPPLDAGTR